MGVRRMIAAQGETVKNMAQIKEDWAWQAKMKGDTDRIKDFRGEVMDSVKFLAFAAMRQGSTTIKVVHSIATCPERGMPREVKRV